VYENGTGLADVRLWVLCDYWDMRCRSADGRWQVDVITLMLTPNHHDGMWLRISEYGWHVADVRTIERLRHYVDPADLEEALSR
jgi:hypothetical protein